MSNPCWQSGQAGFSTGNPAWTVRNGVAYLSGSLHQPTGTSEPSAILTAAARPAHATDLAVYTYDGTKGAVEIEPNGATVLIEPDGTMQAYSAAPGDARQFASLAGVSVPLGS